MFRPASRRRIARQDAANLRLLRGQRAAGPVVRQGACRVAGAPGTLRQVLAMSSPEYPSRIAGSYPQLWPSGQVVAPQGDPCCPTVIYLSARRDKYAGYVLEGGP